MFGKRSSENRKSTLIKVLFLFSDDYGLFIQIKMTYHYFFGKSGNRF